MNERQRFLRGWPALLILLVVGGAALTITAMRLALGSPSAGVAFVVGMGCGYLTALSDRIATSLGPEKVRAHLWVRFALLALFLLPLLSAALIIVFVAPRIGQSFVAGVLAMVCFGVALVNDGPMHERVDVPTGRAILTASRRALLAVGGAALFAVEAYRFASGDVVFGAAAFAVGAACGYLGPLAVRLASMSGRRGEETKNLGSWVLAVFILLPLWSTILAFLVLPHKAAQGFAMGSLGMFFMTLALLERVQGSITPARDRTGGQS